MLASSTLFLVPIAISIRLQRFQRIKHNKHPITESFILPAWIVSLPGYVMRYYFTVTYPAEDIILVVINAV